LEFVARTEATQTGIRAIPPSPAQSLEECGSVGETVYLRLHLSVECDLIGLFGAQ